MQFLIVFLGRLCLSVIFIIAGIHMLFHCRSFEQHFVNILCDWLSLTIGSSDIQKCIEMIIHYSFFIIVATAFFKIAGGLMILLGFNIRLGAFILLILLIPTTILFHHFWTSEGLEQEMQMTHFMKNVGIIGGLLLLLAQGKGKKNKVSTPEKKNS